MKRRRIVKLAKETPRKMESNFTLQYMHQTVKDMQEGKLKFPNDRIQISDDVVQGLRAMIYKSGTISLTIQYWVNRERFMFRVGDLNKDSIDYTTLDVARTRGKAVRELAEKGINIQEGLHQRLWAELDRDGTHWRPALTPPPRGSK